MPVVGPYHHVHLISQEPRTTAEWYVKFLGGEIVRDGELRGARNVSVMLGNSLLNVRGEREGERFVAGSDRLYGIDHFCFQVEDIEGMLKHVEDQGGVISDPLFTLPNGNRGAYVEGPEGVQMELLELAK